MSDEAASTAIDAFQVTLDHTKDISGLEALVADGRLRVDDVIAVTGKTEGCTPGETSRVEADQAIRRFLSEIGTRPAQQIAQIPMVFTAGAVGILTPQVVVYVRAPAEPASDGTPRLAMGIARSALIRPEWTGTSLQIQANADAVRAAAADGGLEPTDIEYVVGKAYYPSLQDLADARTAGHQIPDFDDETLFRKGSGSAGLGVAVAVDGLALPDGVDVGQRMELWSAKVSASANAWESVGGEGPQTQLMAFGNRVGAGGRLRVGHAAIADLLDVDALPRALRRAGLAVGPGPLTPEQRAKVVAVYVKIGPPPDGRLRGRRQVVENPGYGSEVKAAVAGMFAAFLQDNLLWISGSATHQGPVGGGTLAVVVDVT